MLIPLKEGELYDYVDFAYTLALDQTKSGYPIYSDGIKSKEDFIAAAKSSFSSNEEEILLFEHNGVIEGWIQYFWIPEDAYLQMSSCNINQHTDIALNDFLTLVENKYTGYDFYLGFPKCNEAATSFLVRNGFDCIEDDYNDVIFFEEYNLLPESENIYRVTAENYDKFRYLHTKADDKMYWNSDRLLGKISEWEIFVYHQDANPTGAIYFKNEGTMLEIFGIDYADAVFREDVYKELLIKALNAGKTSGAKYMTFFNEEKSQLAALALGFRCVGQYACYLKKL